MCLYTCLFSLPPPFCKKTAKTFNNQRYYRFQCRRRYTLEKIDFFYYEQFQFQNRMKCHLISHNITFSLTRFRALNFFLDFVVVVAAQTARQQPPIELRREFKEKSKIDLLRTNKK